MQLQFPIREATTKKPPELEMSADSTRKMLIPGLVRQIWIRHPDKFSPIANCGTGNEC